MSKQLALSIAFSVLAMTAFALFGDETTAALLDGGASLPIKADIPALPDLSLILPAIQ